MFVCCSVALLCNVNGVNCNFMFREKFFECIFPSPIAEKKKTSAALVRKLESSICLCVCVRKINGLYESFSPDVYTEIKAHMSWTERKKATTGCMHTFLRKHINTESERQKGRKKKSSELLMLVLLLQFLLVHFIILLCLDVPFALSFGVSFTRRVLAYTFTFASFFLIFSSYSTFSYSSLLHFFFTQ